MLMNCIAEIRACKNFVTCSEALIINETFIEHRIRINNIVT